MRLVRLGTARDERPSIMFEDGKAVDVTDYIGDFNPAFFASDGIEELRKLLHGNPARALPIAPIRFGPPVGQPGKIVCIGLNYADHAAESGATIPLEPVVFFKASNTLIGPNDDVRIPRRSR